jgi:hypothetical protein
MDFDLKTAKPIKGFDLSTAKPDVTATQAFNPVKETPVSLADVVGAVGRSQTPTGMAINMAVPQKTAREAGTAVEMGLPMMGLGVSAMPLRILSTGLLQGTGSMLNRGLSDISGRTKPDIPEMFGQGAESALIGGGLQALGELPFAVINKARAPFVGQFDKPVAQLASKYNVELPASSLTKSGFVKATEALAAKSPFGGGMINRVENAGARLKQIGDEMVSRMGKVTSPEELGQSISQGLNRYEDMFRKTKNELYASAQIKKGEIPFTPTQTMPVLDEMINSMENVVGQRPAILGELKAIRKGLGGEVGEMVDKLKAQGFKDDIIQKIIEQNPQALNPNVDALTIKNTIDKLNKKINFNNPNPIVQGYEGQLRKLAKTMSEDLDNSIKIAKPELSEAIDKANEFYKEGITKLNSGWGKRINTFVQQNKLSELPKALLNKGTPAEWIPQIYSTIGEEATQTLKATTLERILENSEGVSGFFTGSGLKGQIKSYGTAKLNAIFGGNATKQLEDLATLANAFKTGQGVAEGSQTAFVAKTIAMLHGFTQYPMKAAKFIVGDKLFTDFVTSPFGQKYLTEGFKQIPSIVQPTVGTATRVLGNELGRNYLNEPTPNK